MQRSLANRFDKGRLKIMKRVVRDVQKELVEVTPFDTGKALSNWRVSPGVDITDDIPTHALHNRGASQRGAIGAARTGIAAMKVGQTTYLVNNTPYIRELNSTKSKSRQAPAGFVKVAVLKGIRKGARGLRVFAD